MSSSTDFSSSPTLKSASVSQSLPEHAAEIETGPQPVTPKASQLDRWMRKALFSQLGKLQHGRLLVREHGANTLFGQGDMTQIAEIHIHHPRAFRDIIFGGSIGAAEAYVAGDWTTPDLAQLMGLLVRNLDLVNAVDDRYAWASKPILQVLHKLHRNSVQGSRRNIAAHYDLGNDLFQAFLDPTLMYSSAIFPSADATLEQAQLNKLERICRKLQLGPQDHLLEIGTGWGGMALYAASRYGCRVTTTTISEQQYALAKERIEQAGLQGRVTLLLEDYRKLQGRYDKLVSIEMIEAVGHQYYPEYFQQCARLLKPDGLALIQAITLPEQRYERAINNVDFIQRYIFPGSCIPSIGAILQATGEASDLRMIHLEDFGEHYARTLSMWRETFMERKSQIQAMGYSEAFIRLWEFYFAYCEGGFAERAIGVSHLLFAKPANRRQALLGQI